MHLVIISHAYVLLENQAFPKRIAELYPADQVTVVIPSEWSTERYGPKTIYEAQKVQEGNYRVLPMPLSEGYIKYYRGLGQFLRETCPDVLYVAEERYVWSALCAFLAAQCNSPKTLLIGGITTNIDYQIKCLHHRLKEIYFFTSCHALIAMNQDAKRIAQQHGFKRKIVVQHGLGVDERIWKPSQIQNNIISHSDKSKPFTIGFVGALSTEKGVVDLLHAVAKVRHGIILELIGDGPERRKLEQTTIELQLEKQVVFRGFQPRSVTVDIIPSFDILVLPSRSTNTWKEQFGLVLAEAMACGVAVVGSDSGAIPEVIGNAGLIFPEGDIEALATCLWQLIDNTIYRRDLAARGHERAIQRFSTKVMAEEFHSFCQEIKGITYQ